jgi:hypothetical protein
MPMPPSPHWETLHARMSAAGHRKRSYIRASHYAQRRSPQRAPRLLKCQVGRQQLGQANIVLRDPDRPQIEQGVDLVEDSAYCAPLLTVLDGTPLSQYLRQ